jgi:hypothetical protein
VNAEREAFEGFIRWMRNAEPALDGMVPVALICMPVQAVQPDGAIDLAMEGPDVVLWRSEFPVSARAPLLERLARNYRADKVIRRMPW